MFIMQANLKVTGRATTQTDSASHRHRPRISEIMSSSVEIRGQKRPLRLYSTIPSTPFVMYFFSVQHI